MGHLGVMFGVLAVAGALAILSAGNASAQSCLCSQEVLEKHKFTLWLPQPATIIAGPGAGTTDAKQTAFGSLAVYDVPAWDGPNEETARELGRARGQFLVDGLSAQNVLMLFTMDFVNDKFNGSLLVSGTMDYSHESWALPVLGGTGAFSSAKGVIVASPALDEKPRDKNWGAEVLEILMKCEVDVTVPKAEAIAFQ